jgi:hypothetical protein
MAAANRSNRGPEACRAASTETGLRRATQLPAFMMPNPRGAPPGTAVRRVRPKKWLSSLVVSFGQTCESRLSAPNLHSFVTEALLQPPAARALLLKANFPHRLDNSRMKPATSNPTRYRKPCPVSSDGIPNALRVQVSMPHGTKKILGRTGAGIKKIRRLSNFDQATVIQRPTAIGRQAPAPCQRPGDLGGGPAVPNLISILTWYSCNSRPAGTRAHPAVSARRHAPAASERSQPPGRRSASSPPGRSRLPESAPARSRPAPRPTAAD